MSLHSDKGRNSEHRVVEFPEQKTVQAQAAKWLAKLDADEPSKEDIEAFKCWINEDKAHRPEFESVMAFWDDLNILTQVVTPREHSVQKKSHEGGNNSGWLRFAGRYTVVGLILSSVLAVAVIITAQLRTPLPLVYTTVIGEQKTVVLPDHTSVLLNTDSRIEVHYDGERRGVHLVQGEAHFDVFHNPQRPFEVYAGKRRVRALGTAFTVHLRNNDVEVVVTEGVVEIDAAGPVQRAADPPYPSQPVKAAGAPVDQQVRAEFEPEEPSPGTAVQVSAGSLATYDRDAVDQVRLAAVEKLEEKLSWHQGILVFKGEPLEKVVEEVSRYTSMKIIIPNRKVRELKIGGIFKVGDTESMFEALHDGFDIHAEHVSENFVYLIFSDNR